MNAPLLMVPLRAPAHVVLARQRARRLAAGLGLEPQDQTRLATAVSEIARNALLYAGGGRVEFSVDATGPRALLLVRVVDQGPGISDLDAVLSGRWRSRTGLGRGILGSRGLMDVFDIQSAPGQGTTVVLGKALHGDPPSKEALSRVVDDVVSQATPGLAEELELQNGELIRALEQLQARHEEVQALNRELADTNRGVIALYAELEEKAEELRGVSELKTRILWHMSHEVRTPLNAVIGLTKLLLDDRAAPLAAEQRTQVQLIEHAASELNLLVSDLLDLARMDAGAASVRPARFELERVLSGLRGMMRPLVPSEGVTLVIEEAQGVPPLCTDEVKLSQILRNLVSNALKFTERGEVRVRARAGEAGEVVVEVSDTGIGIPPEEHERIFREFGQIDGPLQARNRGTGLGLALSRRLAELLGGTLSVRSAPGAGSTFTLRIPASHGCPQPRARGEVRA